MRTVAFLLSLVLVFTIPWEDALNMGGLGTLTRVIGMLTAMAWFSSAIFTRRFRKPHPLHIVMFLFILWNVASFFWSVGIDETVEHIKTYIQLAMLAWILWDLYTTPLALKAALQAYVLGACVTIGSTISNYLAGQIISVHEVGRYAGAGLNAVDLALVLSLSLPIAWHLATTAGNDAKAHVLRLLNYAYIPACLFTIVLTASRMALFTVVPAILYIIGTANQLKPFSRILVFIVLVGTMFALEPYIPQSTVDRLATAGVSIATGDLGGRGGLWRASMEAFLEHPFLGVGSGALSTTNLLGTVAHNTFLSVLAELGLIGFTLFVIMLAIAAVQAANQPKWHAGLWITVLLIWAIGVFNLTWEYRKPTWLFLSLVVISSSSFRRYDSVEERHPSPLSHLS